jgi:hypothetical protein
LETLDPIPPPAARAVTISGRARRTVVELEDNFHHFRLALDHDGARVMAISADAVRHPWSLCPMAIRQLDDFVGRPLAPDQSVVAEGIEATQQCTHLMDLAVLAISVAFRQVARRRYDMTAMRLPVRGLRATLRRDDGLAIDVEVDDDRITSPAEYAGVSIKRGFSQWANAGLSYDLAEAMLLLRRTMFIAGGRRNLDTRRTAADGARNLGACFVMQPARAAQASRMFGSTLEFEGRDGPLALNRAS